MIDLYESYDEVNSEMRRMAAIAFEEESLQLVSHFVTQHPKINVPCTRLYVGSGEDFDAARCLGAPNHLFVPCEDEQ